MATPKTVILTVNSTERNYLPTNEATVAAETLPGHVVNMASDGQLAFFANTVKWSGLLVVENEYAAESSSLVGLTTPYAADAWVPYVVPQRGDTAYLLITDGEDIAVGDFLVPGASGELVERTTEDLDLVIGVALDAVTPSGAAGRCRVRFM